jgi:hypothetical protein
MSRKRPKYSRVRIASKTVQVTRREEWHFYLYLRTRGGSAHKPGTVPIMELVLIRTCSKVDCPARIFSVSEQLDEIRSMYGRKRKDFYPATEQILLAWIREVWAEI